MQQKETFAIIAILTAAIFSSTIGFMMVPANAADQSATVTIHNSGSDKSKEYSDAFSATQTGNTEVSTGLATCSNSADNSATVSGHSHHVHVHQSIDQSNQCSGGGGTAQRFRVPFLPLSGWRGVGF